ncbi:alpha/beta hydrolase [soil metagenome]
MVTPAATPSTDAPRRHAQPSTPATGTDRWQRATSRDGTIIAWRRDGPRRTTRRTAPTPVILCNGIACSTDYWTDLPDAMGVTRPVVQWDYRGHGRSGAPSVTDAVSVDHLMDDLTAVLAASGTDRAVFVGHSFGVQIVLEAARRWPDRVAAVVAVAGAPGTPLPATATRPGIGAVDLLERLHARTPERAGHAWQAWWRSPLTDLLGRAIGGTSQAVPRPVMRSYYEHVSTRDLGVLLAMIRAMQTHDATAVVPGLQVPLLVLAGDADRLTPLPAMMRLALAAPDGELVVCHGATHTLPAEHPQWVAQQLQRLLGRVDAPTPQPLEAPAGA